MHVKNNLSAFFSDVELELVTNEFFLFCKPFGDDEEMAENGFFFWRRVCDGLYMFFGNDEDVGFVLRMNIVESETFFVFMDEGARDFFIADFAKETVGHCLNSNLYSLPFASV